MGAVEAYHIESIDAWDVAAGKLIIEEAGGVVIDTAGKYHFHLLHIQAKSSYPSIIYLRLARFYFILTCNIRILIK